MYWPNHNLHCFFSGVSSKENKTKIFHQRYWRFFVMKMLPLNHAFQTSSSWCLGVFPCLGGIYLPCSPLYSFDTTTPSSNSKEKIISSEKPCTYRNTCKVFTYLHCLLHHHLMTEIKHVKATSCRVIDLEFFWDQTCWKVFCFSNHPLHCN